MSLSVIKDFRAALGPARHQGRRPTCLSFAASDVHQHARQHPDIFCVEWLYYHVSQYAGTGPQSGTTVPDTRAVLKASGQPIERVWPYSPYPPHPSRWSPPAATSKVMTCGSAGCSTGLRGIRQEIDADIPVVIGLYTSMTFNDPTSWDYAGSEVILGADDGLPIDRTRGHAVVVVGRGDYGGELVVLLRNSWGALWGHQGHAWVRESYLGPRLVDAFVISKGDGDVLQSDGRFADADASPRLG